MMGFFASHWKYYKYATRSKVFQSFTDNMAFLRGDFLNNESDIKLNVGFLSVRPEVRIKILPFVQTLGGVKDIMLSELNASNLDLSEYDVVFVSWNIKNKLFLDDLNKIRSVWANRTQVFVGVGDVSDIDKQIAFEFGVGSWLSVQNIETEIAKLKIDLHNYKENNEIYSDLEKKAVLALEDKDITEFKTIMDSLLFIDARNSILLNFLGKFCSRSSFSLRLMTCTNVF